MNQKTNPLISVLIPTYNVEEYIEEAIQSILSQTYSNIEVIVVDDCSTDRTYEIIKRIASSDPRIICSRNDSNSKICKTLNKALELSSGEYILRMDSDDISMPERTEILYNYLQSHKDVDLVANQIISVNENEEFLSYKKYLRTPRFIRIGNRICPNVPHIWLCKKEVYLKLHGYFNFPYVEDYDFLLRGNNIGLRYANVDNYVYKQRIRAGNTGSTNGLRQRKAKRFINKIDYKANRTQKELEKEFQEYISCSPKELQKYEKASLHLSTAIKHRKNFFKMTYHCTMSMFLSIYIFVYIVESIQIRALIIIEDLIYPRKH